MKWLENLKQTTRIRTRVEVDSGIYISEEIVYHLNPHLKILKRGIKYDCLP
jgi:hypothetical protein